MRAKDKLRLGTIRMAQAAVKQKEIDDRVELTDADVLSILTKLVNNVTTPRPSTATQIV